MFADAEKHGLHRLQVHGPQVTIGKSWLAAAKGSESRAVDLAQAAADAAHECGQYAVEAEALHYARGLATAPWPGDLGNSSITLMAA